MLPESGSNTEIVFVLILGLKLSLSKLVQNILQNFLKLYNSVLLDINTVSDIGADLMYILFFFFRLTRDEVESALCYACRLLIKDLVSPLLYTCLCLLSIKYFSCFSFHIACTKYLISNVISSCPRNR